MGGLVLGSFLQFFLSRFEFAGLCFALFAIVCVGIVGFTFVLILLACCFVGLVFDLYKLFCGTW